MLRKWMLALFITPILYADTLGALLFHGNCSTCHYIKEDKSAPSIMKVRQRYKTAFTQKKDFVAYMSQWVANPSAERSIMQDEIQKHGLMPQLAFDEEVLKDITTYIYETDFSKEPTLR
jgi:cytochrome c551/c552